MDPDIATFARSFQKFTDEMVKLAHDQQAGGSTSWGGRSRSSSAST